MRKRGLVLDKTGPNVIVLTPGGSFHRLRRPHARLGDEIDLSSPARTRWLVRCAQVAALLLLFVLPAFVVWYFGPAPAMACVSLDVNPSWEFTVDTRWRVMQAAALDPEAADMLASCQIEGVPLQPAIRRFTEALYQADYLLGPEQPVMIISATELEEGADLPRNAEARLDRVCRTVEHFVRGKGIEIQVGSAVIRDDGFRAQAHELQLSPGRYALFLSRSLAHAIEEAGGSADRLVPGMGRGHELGALAREHSQAMKQQREKEKAQGGDAGDSGRPEDAGKHEQTGRPGGPQSLPGRGGSPAKSGPSGEKGPDGKGTSRREGDRSEPAISPAAGKKGSDWPVHGPAAGRQNPSVGGRSSLKKGQNGRQP